MAINFSQSAFHVNYCPICTYTFLKCVCKFYIDSQMSLDSVPYKNEVTTLITDLPVNFQLTKYKMKYNNLCEQFNIGFHG